MARSPHNYYHHYVDRAAMFDWLEKVGGLTGKPLAPGEQTFGILDHWLGYIVHGAPRSDLAVLKCRGCFQQHHQHDRHGRHHRIVVILLSVNLSKPLRQESRRRDRFRSRRRG